MQFTLSMTTDDVDAIETKTVDTQADLHCPTILFCERWLRLENAIKGSPTSGKRIGMRVIFSNDSAIGVQYEIEGSIQCVMLLLSGVDQSLDTDGANRFIEYCNEINVSVAHDSVRLPAPHAYVVCNPLVQDVSTEDIAEMVALADHFAAAALNMRGRPV